MPPLSLCLRQRAPPLHAQTTAPLPLPCPCLCSPHQLVDILRHVASGQQREQREQHLQQVGEGQGCLGGLPGRHARQAGVRLRLCLLGFLCTLCTGSLHPCRPARAPHLRSCHPPLLPLTALLRHPTCCAGAGARNRGGGRGPAGRLAVPVRGQVRPPAGPVQLLSTPCLFTGCTLPGTALRLGEEASSGAAVSHLRSHQPAPLLASPPCSELSYGDDKLSLASAGTASTAGGTSSRLAPLLFVRDEYRGAASGREGRGGV